MRMVFLRAVLLGMLAALALVVAKRAWAEKTVMITSATEPSPLHIESARKMGWRMMTIRGKISTL